MIKVEQDKQEFVPIKITLETSEVANILFNFIQDYYSEYNIGSKERDFLIELSNKLGEKEF